VAKVPLLIDTDIFIDYFKVGLLRQVFEGTEFEIYYSIVTKKELLSKSGLRESERQAILLTLKRHRLIPLNDRIARQYSELRGRYPTREKADALIAATALVRKLPLVTRNIRHFQNIDGLTIFTGSA
jgi:predicted nucleic acid-binding protein